MKLRHLRFRYILLVLILIVNWVFVTFTKVFDYFFYPSLQNNQVDNPIFIIGHPRSGTTFLHRFLAENCKELIGIRLIDMLFPTITSRMLMRPLYPMLIKLFGSGPYDSKIHLTGLDKVESDDAAIFFRFFDGFLPDIYMSVWSNVHDPSQACVRYPSPSLKHLRFLRNLYNQIIFKSSKRIISKSFSFARNIEIIKREFPSAKFILLVRNPIDSIPSSLSLFESVSRNIFSSGRKFQYKLKIAYRNLYLTSLDYHQNIERTITTDGSHLNNVIIVNYSELKFDFISAINKIIDFCEIHRSEELQLIIFKQFKSQKMYHSKHEYTLSKFGLSRELITKDFSAISHLR